MKVCHGKCEQLKVKRVSRRTYDFNRRCSICEVYYDRSVIICPCCTAITRGKRRWKKRINTEKKVNTMCEDSRSIFRINWNQPLNDSSNPNQIQAEESVI